MRLSTFCDEDLSEVVDLSEQGTWANANLCEIIQDLVDALFPLHTPCRGDTRSALQPLKLCRRLPRNRREAEDHRANAGIH